MGSAPKPALRSRRSCSSAVRCHEQSVRAPTHLMSCLGAGPVSGAAASLGTSPCCRGGPRSPCDDVAPVVLNWKVSVELGGTESPCQVPERNMKIRNIMVPLGRDATSSCYRVLDHWFRSHAMRSLTKQKRQNCSQTNCCECRSTHRTCNRGRTTN